MKNDLRGPRNGVWSPGVWRAWGILIPTVFVVALAWFGWSHRESFVTARGAPILDLLAIALLLAFAHFVNSSQFWFLYAGVRGRLGIAENWLLFTAGQLANHLPGKLGTIYRFRYMRLVHDVSYLHSAAVQATHVVITVAGASLAGVAGILGLSLHGGEPVSAPLLAVFATMAFLAALLAVTPLPRFAGRSGRLATIWHEFHTGFEQIRQHQRAALTTLAFEPLKYGATAWRLQLAFALLNIHESFWFFLVLAAAVDISSVIALTPASFGFREAFMTVTAVALGLDVTVGLLGATVDRAVHLATIAALGGLGFLVTYPRLRHARAYPPSTE